MASGPSLGPNGIGSGVAFGGPNGGPIFSLTSREASGDEKNANRRSTRLCLLAPPRYSGLSNCTGSSSQPQRPQMSYVPGAFSSSVKKPQQGHGYWFCSRTTFVKGIAARVACLITTIGPPNGGSGAESWAVVGHAGFPAMRSKGSASSEQPDHTEEQRSVVRVVDDRQRERMVDDGRDPERGRNISAGGSRGCRSMLVHLEMGLLHDP